MAVPFLLWVYIQLGALADLLQNKVSNENNEINRAQHQQRYPLPPEINAVVVHFDPADLFSALQTVGNGHNGGND